MSLCRQCAASTLDSHRFCSGCGAQLGSAATEAEDPLLGLTLAGKVQLHELIGSGAMGRVYRALHLGLDTQVAVKVLNADLAGDPLIARRFQNEARAASRLHHPNAIAILDFGQDSNKMLYLVMELLHGRTLAQLLRDLGPLSPRRAADLLGQALAALDEAHVVGIIHRDFKPENIFVETLRSGHDHVKVLDFGIAKLQTAAGGQLTSVGIVCGTPDYMSPEQIRGLELDARSDVYSAGAVLYELLTGTRLYPDESSSIDVMHAHLQHPVQAPSVRRPELQIPREIEAVCLRALAKDPAERHESAAELRAAIEEAAVGGLARCARCGAARQLGRFCAECGVPFPVSAHEIDARAPTSPLPLEVATRLDVVRSPQLAPPPLLSLPFCGREALLDRLAGLGVGVVLLVGEPGLGKSRVASAWAQRRREAGRSLVFIEADGSGIVAPLAPIRRAVAALLRIAECPSASAVFTALGEDSSERAGIATLMCPDRSHFSLPLDVRRMECRAATLALMRRSEVDFVFEDLHLYDGVSRGILDELAAQPGRATVLFTSSRAEVLAAEADGLEVLVLSALDPEVLATLGVGPAIIESCDGSPLRLDTALRALAEGAAVPTIAGRLATLSADERTVVELLAVAGAPLPHGALLAAAGRSSLDAAVSELARRGLIAATGSPHRLGSQTQRLAVYEGIDVERRRAMHARLGAVLEEAGADVHLIAYHALLSGEGDPVQLPELGPGPTLSLIEGVFALKHAGLTARECFDDVAASRALRAAMERCRVARMRGVGDDRQLIQIELKLGVVLRYTGDLAGAETVLREAVQLAQAERMGWAAVEARRALARCMTIGGSPMRARMESNHAVRAALALGDPAMLCESYLDLAEGLIAAGELAEAARELEEGVLLVTQGDGPAIESGPDALAHLIARLAEVRASLGEHALTPALLAHALRLGARSTRGNDRARLHAVAARVFRAGGRHAEACEQRQSAITELRDLGDRRSTAEQLLALAADSRDNAPRDAIADPVQMVWLKEAERLAVQIDWVEGSLSSRARQRELA